MKSIKNIAIIALLLVIVVTMVFASYDVRLYIAYGLLAITLLALAVAVVANFFGGTKKNMATIIGGAILVGLIILFYFIVPRQDVTQALYDKTKTGFGWSPIIGAGLYTIYALIGIFVLILVFFGVKSIFKS